MHWSNVIPTSTPPPPPSLSMAVLRKPPEQIFCPVRSGFYSCLTTNTRPYTVISYLTYTDKQCDPDGVGHFLCFDTNQCQLPHMFRGWRLGLTSELALRRRQFGADCLLRRRVNTLETLATHQTSRAKNISDQPLLINTHYSLLVDNAKKTGFFSKPVFQYKTCTNSFA